MAIKKLSEREVKTYSEMLSGLGDNNFHSRLVGQGIMRFALKIEFPDLELLDLADSFFAASRVKDDEALFRIGRIMRRAAHTLYRHLAKVRKTNNSSRFLQLVK